MELAFGILQPAVAAGLDQCLLVGGQPRDGFAVQFAVRGDALLRHQIAAQRRQSRGLKAEDGFREALDQPAAAVEGEARPSGAAHQAARGG